MSRVRPILAAVDLTDHSTAVVREAIALARALDTELLVVHAVHDLSAMYGVYVGGGSVNALQHEIDENAAQKLAELIAEHVEGHGVTARDVLLHGTPWAEILSCGAHHGAERIVIGGHVAEKPEHRVLGSTVDRVLRHAPCPVVVVPGPRR